jgi:energy-coupling factor transporter ATP-binding protein EcfA2
MSISDFAENKPPEGSGTNWTEGEPSTSAPTENKTSEETTPSPSEATPSPQVTNPKDVASGAQDTSATTTSTPATTAPSGNTNDILAGILDKIGEIGADKRLKLMIIGPPGQGKSSLLATAENCLAHDFEDGLVAAKGSPHGVGKGTLSIPYTGMDDFRNLIGGFVNGDPRLAKFEVYGLDTLSDLHKRDLAEICDREWRRQPSRNRYVPETENYTEVNERIVRVVRALRDLPIDIIINSHSRTVEPKGKAAKTYADFSESLSNKIMAMMDVVGYLQFKAIDKKMVPVLRVKTEGTIHCKSRAFMPDEIINPTYKKIKDLWVEGIENGWVEPN